MPSADDLIPDFDDFESTPIQAPEPEPATQPTIEEEVFTDIPSKKKKKKTKKHATRARSEDEEEALPQPITPSPSIDHGLRFSSSLPLQLVEHVDSQFQPPPAAAAISFEDEETAVEEPDPPPQTSPKPPPAIPPNLRSPRPAFANLSSAGVSPPVRPASLHSPPQQHAGLASTRPNSSFSQAPRPRRESFAKQASPRPHFLEAPLPHMPQAHFFSVPELSLHLSQKTEHGKSAGSDGYCCRFDTFADSGDLASARKAKDALLVGSERGLEVYRILPDKIEVVGRLEGLRGSVLDAKLIPHARLYDAWHASRPLIVVTVHGPLIEKAEESGQDDEMQKERPSHYQTTVEIYSLQTQNHVATLYKSVPVATKVPVMGHLALPPPPYGDISLDTRGDFITIASGKSGEVFVFSSALTDDVQEAQFRCIGKFWTALQTSLDSTPRPSSPGEPEPEKRPRIPLLGLSDRWLAVVPPYSSAGICIQGAPALLDANTTPPGLNTHTTPIQPPVTCEIAGIDAEGTWSWLSRKAAQGLVKASQKGYEMGIQSWRELTHPSQSTQQRTGSTERDIFPPTFAPTDDPKLNAKDPALISIIDLKRLLAAEEQRSKTSPAPLSTFALVEGCNHLSFSPDGLRLLTSNLRGEVSTVWELQHVAYSGATHLSGQEGELNRDPHVRQIQRIVRSSPSMVVDSVWSRDGDWLALLTAHGTVHLHEIASHATSRKRKRRATVTALSPEKAEPTVSVSQGVSPPSSNGDLWASVRSSLQTVSRQVNNMRSTSGSAGFPIPTSFAGFREATAAAGSAGGRAVAKGFAQGYNVAKGGASDMWHAEDNKIRHKALQGSIRAGCLRWSQRQSGTSLLVVCDGSVHLHPVQRVTRHKGDMIASGLKQDKHAHKAFALPRISTIREEMAVGKVSRCAAEGPHGFWSLRHTPTSDTRPPSSQVAPPLSQANDIETNPPYCPFHVDSRVSIFAFNDNEAVTSEWQYRGYGFEDEDPWLFGEPLPPGTKMNDCGQSDADNPEAEDGDTDTDDVADQMESKLTVHEFGNGGERQIRVITRRARKAGLVMGRVEEGGFEVVEDDDSIL